MVYDRELKYMRRVEHSGLGEFRGMSADNYGNLYVTDYTSDYVRVFGNDGVFLRSFGTDSNGVKRLNSPYYMCVCLVIMCMSLIVVVIMCQCSLLQGIMSPHLVSVVVGKVNLIFNMVCALIRMVLCMWLTLITIQFNAFELQVVFCSLQLIFLVIFYVYFLYLL